MDLKFYAHFPQSPALDLLGCRGSIRVEGYRWDAIGGPERASLRLTVRPADLLAVPRLLGAPVEVWGPRLERVWWGYLHSVRIGAARYSLDAMYNRVAAIYADGEITDWVEDSASIRAYGVREYLLEAPNSAASAAEGMRDAFLAAHAQPPAELSLDIDARTETEVRLEARGWYGTLGWRYLQQPMAVAASGASAASTWAAVGDDLARRKLAQPLTVPAGETWTLRRANLLLRRTGEPGDRLLVRLHADDGGLPGECLATARIEAAAVYPAGGWLAADFETPVEAGSGAYWLVVNRSGGTDSGSYLSVGAGSGGTYQVYNGTSWGSGSGTLVVEVLGGEHRPGNEIIEAAYAAAGAFLTGLGYTGPYPPIIPPGALPDFEAYQDGTRTALDVLGDVLAAGSSSGRRLLARVTERRVLQVYPRPSAGDSTLRVEGGRFYEGAQRVDPWELGRLVGRWVRTASGDVFVGERAYRVEE